MVKNIKVKRRMDRKEELKEQIRKLNQELEEILEKEREEKDMADFEDDLQMQVIGDSVVILRGGIGKANPGEFINKAVRYIHNGFGGKDYDVIGFTEETLDNPWVRVLVFNPNTMDFADDFNDVIKKIKV